MCDVCVLAAEASARYASRLRAGAHERLARQVIDPLHAEVGGAASERAASGVGRLVKLAIQVLASAAFWTRTEPAR